MSVGGENDPTDTIIMGVLSGWISVMNLALGKRSIAVLEAFFVRLLEGMSARVLLYYFITLLLYYISVHKIVLFISIYVYTYNSQYCTIKHSIQSKMSQFNDMFSSYYFDVVRKTIMSQVYNSRFPSSSNARIIAITIKNEHIKQVHSYGGERFCHEMMQFINTVGGYSYDISCFREKSYDTHTVDKPRLIDLFLPNGYVCSFKDDGMR
jgi:hypothetical protein